MVCEPLTKSLLGGDSIARAVRVALGFRWAPKRDPLLKEA